MQQFIIGQIPSHLGLATFNTQYDVTSIHSKMNTTYTKALESILMPLESYMIKETHLQAHLYSFNNFL